MYLVHYVFVVWLQYALLGPALPALVKGAIVFAVTLALSWIAVAMLGRLPLLGHIVGAAPTATHAAQPPSRSDLLARR